MKLSILSFIFFVACTSQPAITVPQKRAMQTRTYEDVSYDLVFHALKDVLLDEGYMISNQEYQGGFIVGTKQVDMPQNGARTFFNIFSKTHPRDASYNIGETYKFSVNLTKINETITEVRSTLQQITMRNTGASRGKEILNPEFFKNFYNRVLVQVNRLRAKGR